MKDHLNNFKTIFWSLRNWFIFVIHFNGDPVLFNWNSVMPLTALFVTCLQCLLPWLDAAKTDKCSKHYLFYTDEATLLTLTTLPKQSNMSHCFRLILCFICRYFIVLLVLPPVCRHVSYLDLRRQEERKQSSLSPLSERSLFPEIHRKSQTGNIAWVGKITLKIK